MNKEFDVEAAKKHLAKQEENTKELNEKCRQDLLEKAVNYLKKLFSGTEVGVVLVGSITRPYSFRKASDIDVVLKNFKGDRLDILTDLETHLGREVEVILYEKCHFKDHIDDQGLKVL